MNADSSGEPLRMVRFEANNRAMARWMGPRGLRDTGDALRCLLKECLGEKRPLVFRPMPKNRQPVRIVLGYCRHGQEELEDELQMLADPMQRQALPRGCVATKDMPGEWPEGKVLRFEARMRPVVRLDRKLDPIHPGVLEHLGRPGVNLGQECDAHRWREMKINGDGERPDRQRSYGEWLSERAARQGGCEIDARQVELTTYRKSPMVTRSNPRGVIGPDAILRGVLRIVDPERFAEVIAAGIGRHRAYGYGMILLRPAMERRD